MTDKYLFRISVIIPVYNAEAYLNACIDSILQQTYHDYEIILVNDGSKDSSQAICETYASEYSNIRLLNQANSGVDKARNAGIAMAKGEYITFMDSDDWAESHWLETYMNTLKRFPSDLLVQGLTIDNGITARKEYLPEETESGVNIIRAILRLEEKSLSGFVHNKMYKTSIIRENKISFEFMFKEDLLFNLHYFSCIQSIAIIPEAHYHYMQRSGESLIKKKYSPLYMQQLNKSLEKAGAKLADHCHSTEYKHYIAQRYLSDYIILIAGMYRKPYNTFTKEERIDIITEFQQARRERPSAIPTFNSMTKICFSKLTLLPPMLCDALFNVLFFKMGSN